MLALCAVQWVAGALGLAAFVGDQFCTGSDCLRTYVVLDQVGGALSYAAVPRVGLGPTTPP
jgi:hypothetical protein